MFSIKAVFISVFNTLTASDQCLNFTTCAYANTHNHSVKLVQEGSGLQESNNIGSPAAKLNLMTAPNISAENQSTQMVAQIASQMLNDMQGKLVL